jgi:hypothetical protein
MKIGAIINNLQPMSRGYLKIKKRIHGLFHCPFHDLLLQVPAGWNNANVLNPFAYFMRQGD